MTRKNKVYDASGQGTVLFSRRQGTTRQDNLEPIVSAGRKTELWFLALDFCQQEE